MHIIHAAVVLWNFRYIFGTGLLMLAGLVAYGLGIAPEHADD